MSFFGFDTSLPRDRPAHHSSAPGFGQTPDPWAGLSGQGAPADDDALNFDDTYDGLGDQLDETDDAFNDDTFGGEPAQSVGKDFDFSGQTAKIAGTIHEEQMLYSARQPPSQVKREERKPVKTGYENYAQPGYIGNLEASADIWGIPKKTTPSQENQRQQLPPQHAAPAASRKMMSLEEVEAAMLAQKKYGVQQQPVQPPVTQPTPQPAMPGFPQQPPPNWGQQPFGAPPQILQRHQQFPPQFAQQRPPSIPQQQMPHELPAQSIPQPQILQRQRQEQQGQRGTPPQMHQLPQQPRQILQNPNRLSGPGQPVAQAFNRMPPTGPAHARGPSYQGQVITHPEQLLRLSDAERAAFLEEDAKRAKRIHKIHMLSKDNGLMTPQDKNFITRIQLQQLVTATGSIDDQGPEAALAEDFYYQVFSQIRGAPRQNPHQPANQFAQTYLFQTGGRYGGRRHHRGGDNHAQRMEQQVQRAVEAAKAKPKNKQLVIEGSLGKISFSNAKTPKPLLNIKKPEGEGRPNGAGRRPSRAHHDVADRKATLRNIENVYNILMKMEDHERNMPPPLNDGSSPAQIQEHMEWQHKVQELNQKLWQSLKVMDPIMPGSNVPHPFIAILSHPKGKKAIPRIFRHIDEQQRVTILTMIVVHLDTLDVVQHGIPADPLTPLPRAAKEEIELFAQAVMPPLFAYVNEAPLNIVIGLLGLVLDRTNIPVLVRTKIGLSILTIFVSRAELVKESTPPSAATSQDLQQIEQLYNRLFDTVEPVLPYIFPGTVKDDEDVYVWQFLASMGASASAEQQQRLVIGVKDRVMDTVNICKALPKELSATRLGHVNLFMRAIGLDVELLG
ncbi:DNA topoisomerase 2-associated protein pat1 [Lasiodiplodia theobromae]|uniref:DNA topoisomerase 2-associated protein pat1 n=1 Tax=Lasiodiplodia theobromae TaxID=45133 RepID=A0A5N5DU14_9PEZI|nr:DNA topoisomerase 2-associated protein pat1 [Lasiodiplodia theobromae]